MGKVSVAVKEDHCRVETSGFEAVIIGCGIAGASVAYFLSQRGMTDILILERETQPGYHATGRSAAVLVEFDMVRPILQLKLLGARFLRNPPAGFSENPLLQQSGILILFQAPLWQHVAQMIPDLKRWGVAVDVLDREETVKRMPVVSPENFDGALLLPQDGRIDVNELLWGYLKQARARGARLLCNEEVSDIMVERGRCVGVRTSSGTYRSRWVINAAGAWAGQIRELIGPSPVQLTPHRRTIVTFKPPEGLVVRQWPLVADLSHDLYFSPESAGLMASPMDQDPMPACDVRPDEMGVARTMERLEEITPRLVPRSIVHKWAGLRTFAPDQVMVVGEDTDVKGFFWLAGQGGAGIETSPAVGRIAADLMVDGRTDLVDARLYSPARFGR
ncbi:MAG: FAD-binding oxidoreductase [Deltaproteobacteria bacterium]|nr:FAD-binding oxidoreductase [Deltaproteobacteria bacterium]